MELTIVYVTSREQPHSEWFRDSLGKQIKDGDKILPMVVDTFFGKRSTPGLFQVPIKPTIWQGSHRLTKEDWWAKSNALNTGICLCETEWIAFVDDRSVLMPGWLDAIQRAMDGNYAVCGRYEKRSNVKVDNGIITDMGTELGLDHRQDLPFPQPTDNWMGGHGALPLEWCLAVNGFPEVADGLGSEDSLFGMTLYNAGFPIRYDSKMLIIEDRTVGEIDGALRRSDFGESPNDASHRLVSMFAGQRTSLNPFSIRDMRDSVLAGNSFPAPTADTNHFFTGRPISEME